MYVNDEIDFAILKQAEELLKEQFDWNIKDDDFKGFVNEDPYNIIEDLCDEIIKLQMDKKLENDYFDEERDREKEVLGI